MDLRFDYNFPIPQQYNLLKRPDFKGIIPKYQIGNWEFDVMDIDINLDVSFYGSTFHLHSDNMINMVNGKLNDFTGTQFNNLFLKIQDNVIQSFDPSFKERYSKYTTRLNSLVDKSKYRMTFGYTEKKQGYSHINNWIMDYNGGLTVKIGQSTSISGNSYGYEMKAGSFFGKARIGGDWYKIRLVVKKD